MRISNNADDYTNGRVGIFFPAKDNNTLQDGNLTGQCVSLVKWFLYEMTEVPAPATARGHAKDFRNNLQAQGHAYEVPAAQRRRGDLVDWRADGGGYGHIGVLMSGDRVFESNVGLAGTPSRNINGGAVYGSRIDPLYATWRKGAPRFFRVRSYGENNPQPIPSNNSGGNNVPVKTTIDTARILLHGVVARNGLRGRAYALDGSVDDDIRQNHLGVDLTNEYVQGLFLSQEGRQFRDTSEANSVPGINATLAFAEMVRRDDWEGQIHRLNAAIQGSVSLEDLQKAKETAAALQASLDEANKNAEKANAQAAIAHAEAEKLRAEQQENEQTSKNFLQILGNFLKQYIGKGK